VLHEECAISADRREGAYLPGDGVGLEQAPTLVRRSGKPPGADLVAEDEWSCRGAAGQRRCRAGSRWWCRGPTTGVPTRSRAASAVPLGDPAAVVSHKPTVDAGCRPGASCRRRMQFLGPTVGLSAAGDHPTDRAVDRGLPRRGVRVGRRRPRQRPARAGQAVPAGHRRGPRERQQGTGRLANDFRESTGWWADVLRDCARRGMRAPVLAVGDGAPGSWAALRELFPIPASSGAGSTNRERTFRAAPVRAPGRQGRPGRDLRRRRQDTRAPRRPAVRRPVQGPSSATRSPRSSTTWTC
jgi:hypothetical protein